MDYIYASGANDEQILQCGRRFVLFPIASSCIICVKLWCLPDGLLEYNPEFSMSYQRRLHVC